MQRPAEVLTEANEELLWSKGLLGDATPQSLLDTLVFYNELFFFALSGKEHRQLRSSPCQIQVNAKERGPIFATQKTSLRITQKA